MIDCPTPEKRRYESRRDAARGKRRSRRIVGDNRVRPYHCRCGWWHLGHLGTEVISGRKTRAEAYGSAA